ncbi:hypothetical protein [Brevibacillus laterosporus]|uniref:hypothetical protein n=1 Tax=Brevibacillus laterosporus TaxID=1465 RepID=UPI000EAB8D1D|nr:hypothetical protein [Brevibacillus laterosporus]AYK07744.1 hypothetical protein D8Z77_15960 [Brevibacillus laterosporus]
MGYRTRFSLEITPECREVYDHLARDEYVDYVLGSGEPATWYVHEADMVQMSLKFPDILFELTGDGEDTDDLWRKYFKNGKIQRCPAIITYDAFDESKLSEVAA